MSDTTITSPQAAAGPGPTTPQAPPALTTGWEPEADLDPGDTVLRRFVLHVAAHFASAARLSGGRVDRTDAVALADVGRPSGFYNAAVLLRPPDPDGWDRALDTVEAFYGAGGTGEVLLFSPWPTPDLRARGWQLEGHPPLLVRQPSGPVPPPAAGVDVVAVHDTATLDDWGRVVVEGYPLRELQPYRPGTLLGAGVLDDPRWRLWVAYDRGAPVSVGTLFTSHGFAQFALGVTLPAARGRGIWYGLVRERLLAASDVLTGSLFSDDSRPGVEKLGFLPITRFTLWHRPRR